MPDMHDNQNLDDAATTVPAEVVVPATDEVLDAELVVEEAPTAKEEEGATAETADETSDEEAESAEGQRPSFHGHKAIPHAHEQKAKRKRKPYKPNPKLIRRVLLGLIVAILLAILVGTSLFCWQKWMRFDDTADIQGVWKVEATGDTIVFDGRKLKLTKGISYEYRMNTDDKLIAYTFGELEGGGHYYFSGDRTKLIIIDGDERLDAFAEVGFLPEDLLEHDDATDNKTVLTKVSDDTSAEPSGTATGVSTGHAAGEREYVVKPEPSSSSSSSSEKKKSKSSSESEDDESRGFVDEDGDGYDDETGLDYDEFRESRNADDSDDAEDEGAEDDSDDAEDDSSEGDESEDEWDADYDADYADESDDEFYE